MQDDAISRRAAIDAVHRNYDTILVFRSDGETVANSVEDILSELPSAQQWISCEERLPEPGVNVLVDVLDIPADERFPLVDKIGDDGGWCNCYGEWFAVAWMPIPDPYKEGEK